jgi:hypothetical protein
MKKQLLTLAAFTLATAAMIITGCKKDDTTAPVITLIGSNASLFIGQTYTDAGATAEDEQDGNLTSSITVTNSVNTARRGSYTVHYSVTDAAGNEGTADRTVTVTNEADALAGAWTNIKDSLWSGFVSTYSDNISASDTVNNLIKVTKFGNYQNGIVWINVLNSVTNVSVPVQNVTCGSPSALRTFQTLTNGTIVNTPAQQIQFDYQEIVSSTSTSTMARATYKR